jgi:hypothetical protein
VIKLNRINETNKITLKMTINAHMLKFGIVISLSLVLNNLERERELEIVKSIEDLDQRFTLRSCISGQLQMVVVEDLCISGRLQTCLCSRSSSNSASGSVSRHVATDGVICNNR